MSFQIAHFSQLFQANRPGIASAGLKLGGRGVRKLLHRTAAQIVLIVILGVAVAAPAPAQGQDRWLDLPAPAGVTAANGANPGEAVISWQPVAGAAFYRIAWIAAADADEIADNGGDWLSAITFTDIIADADAADPQQHTLTRLNPGVRYIFQVGSRRLAAGTPAWSSPTELYLAMGALAHDPGRDIAAPVGLTANEPGAFGGYTMFSTRNETTYLIDQAGRMVQSWDAPEIDHPRLLENGNLLGTFHRSGVIYEVDPAGNLLWQYRHPLQQHHDFLQLPNGNILMIVREDKTRAEVIAAGANPAFVSPDGMNNEIIVEIRPIYPDRAAVVWQWSLWDHLVQDYDPDQANYGKVSEHPELVDLNYTLRERSQTERAPQVNLLHMNGLDYHPELDQIVLSARNMSEIWIIDHSTTTAEAAGHSGGNGGRGGDLLYRWGNPQAYRAGTFADQQLFWQHHPQWIPDGLPGAGNILIFNNGDEYEGRRRGYSSVVEITPPVTGRGYAMDQGAGSRYGPAQPTWTYTAENPGDFLSYRLSGVQRLPNGNTMVVSGMDGVIFEVTPAGATVWRYVNPVIWSGPVQQGDAIGVAQNPASRHRPGQWWNNSIYRAYRYAPDYPGLQHYNLTPQGTVERYRDGGP